MTPGSQEVTFLELSLLFCHSGRLGFELLLPTWAIRREAGVQALECFHPSLTPPCCQAEVKRSGLGAGNPGPGHMLPIQTKLDLYPIPGPRDPML